jgi:hypothetical protein
MEYTDTNQKPQFVLFFALTKEDYVEKYSFFYRMTGTGRQVIRSTRIQLTIIYFTTSFFVLQQIAPFSGNSVDSSFSYIALLLFSLFYAMRMFCLQKRVAKGVYNRLFRHDNSLHAPAELRMQQEWLQLQKEWSGERFHYSVLSAICGTENGIHLLFYSINQTIFVPNHAFENREQRESFLSELSTRSGVPVT